jgi:hypothetical protein
VLIPAGGRGVFIVIQKSNPLEVSAEILKPHTAEWLKETMEGSALLGGILSIMHPELFKAACELLRKMADAPEYIFKGENLAIILRFWSSPFSVLSLISNRKTPYHRDNGSAYSWFDILCPLGTYESGRLELPGLGLRLKYNPGTVVGLTGRILRHGATCSGDRACLAFYMRENVFAEFGLEQVSWSNLAQFY